MMASVRRERRMASPAARRSPLTRVRSLASIAASVPVPMARPRSAWASAAASFTPSPTIATTWPCSCNRLMTETLSAGSTSEKTSSGAMPTLAATATAAALLSPVSKTGRRPCARRSMIACALVGFTVSATTKTARAWPSHPAMIGVCPSASDVVLTSSSSGGNGMEQSAINDVRPAIAAWPSTRPCTPSPARLAKLSTVGNVPIRSRAVLAIARAMGCSEAASNAPMMRSASCSVAS